MDEEVRAIDLLDRREVRRGGRPIWIEPLRLTGEVLARGTRALLGGARAVATLALFGRGAEDAVGLLRAPPRGRRVRRLRLGRARGDADAGGGCRAPCAGRWRA